MKKLAALILVSFVMFAAACSAVAPAPAAPATPAAPAAPTPLPTKQPITINPDTSAEPAATIDPSIEWNGPQFNIVNSEGEDVNIATLAGKPIILNVWATWCPPCVEELPYFQTAYESLAEQVNFVMLSTDSSLETALQFAEENNYTFPVYFDAYLGCANYYNITAIPTTITFDAAGNQIENHLGGLSEDAFHELMDRMLGE